jgi:hypothetical protein
LCGGEAIGFLFFPGLGEAGAVGAVGFPAEGAAFAGCGGAFDIVTCFGYKSGAYLARLGNELLDA